MHQRLGDRDNFDVMSRRRGVVADTVVANIHAFFDAITASTSASAEVRRGARWRKERRPWLPTPAAVVMLQFAAKSVILRLACRLVVHTNGVTVEARIATAVTIVLIIPYAPVDHNRLQVQVGFAGGVVQAGCDQGCLDRLALLVEKGVEKTLPTLCTHKLIPTWKKTTSPPAGRNGKRHVCTKEFSGSQQPLVRAKGKKAHVEWLAYSATSTDKVAFCGALQDSSHISLELYILVIENHGIVLIHS